MNDDQQALEHFSGSARLFPLPNLVLFPTVVQPLHIFEPRYRQMTAEALAGDRLIALALFEPGWEEDQYEGEPNLFPIACLGRIIADQTLPDGRYNLLLRGLRRIRIIEEIPSEKLFRSARVELLDDVVSDDLEAAMHVRRQLSEAVLLRYGHSDANREQLQALFNSEMLLGNLCDVLAFALPLTGAAKQALLAEIVVLDRAQLLLDSLETMPLPKHAAGMRKFPPDFSAN
jgi:Lon protease-like protein